MSRLRIAYGGVPYVDRMAALATGEVVADGIDLNYVRVRNPGELFQRMAQHAEFDVAEMSLCTTMIMRSQGDDRFVAIPVFPSRAFRHSQLYVHRDSGIRRPEDLVGKNVGVPEYQMTAAVWIRAFLQHDYGVRPSDVHWWCGGLMAPPYVERHPVRLPADVRLDRIPTDTYLEAMISSGEIDALATAIAPRAFREGSDAVRRLFPDFRAVEQEYFKRTGIFPIMHTVVIRRELYERNRWMAVSLVDAFEASKQRSYQRMRELDTLAVAHPWITDELDNLTSLFGGDPFAYGLGANRRVLEAIAGYAAEQGLTERLVAPEEPFAAETHDWTPPPSRISAERS
jgi:4,5-dihydroxyphthalate decarboxylase